MTSPHALIEGTREGLVERLRDILADCGQPECGICPTVIEAADTIAELDRKLGVRDTANRPTLSKMETVRTDTLEAMLAETTPGPWEVRKCGHSWDICLPPAPGGRGVVVVATGFGGRNDAALIAAAPDLARDNIALREALEQSRAWMFECWGWLMETDLDMTCPMETDPLDIVEQIDALLGIEPAALSQAESVK